MGRPLDQQIQQARVNFLLNDADVALTMLDIADGTQIPENRSRARSVAAQAYSTITRFMPRSQLTSEQHAILNEKLSMIRMRLHIHAGSQKP
ncbi:MAG TPA: hypothetical protein VGT04_14285 [Acidobacteriaceae bacterium]|nr:hypothetical protein [Acidobacteriaceae bacterium]